MNNSKCDKDMKFEDCELAILRHAVDEGEVVQKKNEMNPEIDAILKILEEFIINKKLILYGGLALNNLMPQDVRFYDEELDVPDYDMFSANALDDAKELADVYFSAGYKEVEAKSGVHYGTFKVFVNFIGVADITQLPPALYQKLSADSVIISNMHYSPPDYLRMAMYLELSRPAGDITRWEKVLKRLTLLNRYYPLQTPVNCKFFDFQRKMETIKDMNENEKIFFLTRDFFIEKEVVFFGGYASSLYSKYMPKEEEKILQNNPDFDVLSTDIDKCAKELVEKLKANGYKNAKYTTNDAIGELIPRHIQINIGIDIIAFIFEPIACHSYNRIKFDKYNVNIATIDTMLSFYLAFIYIDKFKFMKERILCMAKFLFEVQQKNRLEQRGLLKRFTISCYGKQLSLKSIRSEKSEKYRELADKKGTREYEMWFLKYSPHLKNKNIEKNKSFVPEETINKEPESTIEKKKSFVPEETINKEPESTIEKRKSFVPEETINKEPESTIEKSKKLKSFKWKTNKWKTNKYKNKNKNKKKKNTQKNHKKLNIYEPNFNAFFK